MKYSIIVINNKKSNNINKCLKSILDQTYMNYEILVINNDINTNINNIKNKYINDYNNIKFYDLPLYSTSNVRNFAIQNAKGKYILFVNSNDKLNNKKVLKLINNYLQDNEVDTLKCKVNSLDNNYDNRFSNIIFDNLNGEEALITYCKEAKIFATNFSYIFKREFLLDNRLYFVDNTYHEDYGLIPMIIYKSSKVSSIDVKMYDYKTTVSENTNIEKMNDFLFHTYNNICYFKKNIKNSELITNYFYSRLNIKLDKINKDDLSNINTLLLKECKRISKGKINETYNKIDEILKLYHFNNFPIEYNISLKIVVDASKKLFKDNLLSVTMGGSAGKNNIIPDWSDLDLYFILKEYDFKKIEEFDKLLSKFNVHIGTTYYSINEVNNMYLDAKTKIMIYEKNNYNVNPTLYGKDYYKKVNYSDIRVNDMNVLPTILHEVRRMHISQLNNKNKLSNKYLKKIVLLIITFLSCNYVFTYGYKNVIDEFLKIVNSDKPLSNRIYFDIESVIKNYDIMNQDILEFGRMSISFIENNLKEE